MIQKVIYNWVKNVLILFDNTGRVFWLIVPYLG